MIQEFKLSEISVGDIILEHGIQAPRRGFTDTYLVLQTDVSCDKLITPSSSVLISLLVYSSHRQNIIKWGWLPATTIVSVIKYNQDDMKIDSIKNKCPFCESAGMKVIIKNRDVACQYHWQLLTPQLRSEVVWKDKTQHPDVPIDWYTHARRYLSVKDMFIHKTEESNNGGDTLVNVLTLITIIATILLAGYATLTVMK